MADELSTPASDAVGTDTATKTPAVKKTRAPRRSKTVAEVATSEAAAAPKGRRGGRRKAEAVEVASAPVAAKRKARGPAKATAAPKASERVASVSTSDDLADLLQLEEENKLLRKTLAEKLRAENADLRKRIGS
ncbi:SyrB-like regulator [Rhizobium leguminosarum]|uniref:SyrB-like regulator n=1 Tax=Rhizobium TaxID=379 RepID=UPI001C90D10C|nr:MULTISPECIES: SyrB-like regulator [Rhizobium]MBY3483288.1 SyrB-like regulator [Rhizobium laguerreae]MBY5572262.1 SyrB-like regulator [Rhizobium leguminosarum]MBY5578936.1 SyrB-like regulator [Rhizobium leguminosarum]